jgi:hypothetical protein
VDLAGGLADDIAEFIDRLHRSFATKEHKGHKDGDELLRCASWYGACPFVAP